MIINPNTDYGRSQLGTLPGSRIVEATLGVVGDSFLDPENTRRIWTVQNLYAPVAGRAIGGIRAKVTDQKGFFSFCNQRDLEVLLGIASPGGYCDWLDREYAGFDDCDWIGLGVDSEDLLDDLFERELGVRAELPPASLIPEGYCVERRVHDGGQNDYVETLVMLADIDRLTGFGPDCRHSTLEHRWVRVECTEAQERRRLWRKL